MRKEEIAAFRKMLVELRRKLSSNISHIEAEALRTGGETSDDLAEIPIEHLADRGSENFVRDMMINIMQSSEAEIHDIDTALAKIDSGAYGNCESCERKIDKGRLKALPFARLCIECKQSEEKRVPEP